VRPGLRPLSLWAQLDGCAMKRADDYQALQGGQYSARAFHDTCSARHRPLWLHRNMCWERENNGAMLE